MSKRPIIYGYEQARTFDVLSAFRYFMEGDSRVAASVLGNPAYPVVSGGAVTYPGGLSINLDPLAVMQTADVDATAYGALAVDTRQIYQIGVNDNPTTLTFSLAQLGSNQQQFALVQAVFSPVDTIPTNDPNGGVLNYFNATNPSQPYQGQNNDGQAQNTLRSGTVGFVISYGGVATTGSATPPTPVNGSAPLYLVLLSYGQTAITANDVFIAGPSVTGGVPTNYPSAPFLAGLLNSHHNGSAGQAPKINLPTEVQGALPLGNLPVEFNGSTSTAPMYNGVDLITTAQFTQSTRYTATFNTSYTPAINTTNLYEAVTVTFPAFSKTGAFRVLARLVGQGASTAANAYNNMTNQLRDGSNIYTGAPWYVYLVVANDTWGTTDTLLTSATYAPSAVVTFSHYIETGGGIAGGLTVAGASMELYVVEA